MPLLRTPDLRAPDGIRVEFDPAWAVQSMFGGAVAAVAVRCARAALETDLVLSDGLFAFLAPTRPGPAEVEVRPTRAGRRFGGATVVVRQGGVTTVRADLAFAEGAAPVEVRRPAAPPARGRASFDGSVQWHASEPARGGVFEAWVRAVGDRAEMPFDEWACIAADLLGPAVAERVGAPFAVATATLAVSVGGSFSPGAWMRQSVTGSLSDRVAAGVLELTGADGLLLVRATQRAAIVSTGPEELPRAITGFASSGMHSTLFGMN